jgi:hypothetical protein
MQLRVPEPQNLEFTVIDFQIHYNFCFLPENLLIVYNIVSQRKYILNSKQIVEI